MPKTNITFLDWAALVVKYSYAAIGFLVIQLVVMVKNVHVGGQKLITYGPKKNPLQQIKSSKEKTALETHIMSDLYLTKSTAQKKKVKI